MMSAIKAVSTRATKLSKRWYRVSTSHSDLSCCQRVCFAIASPLRFLLVGCDAGATLEHEFPQDRAVAAVEVLAIASDREIGVLQHPSDNARTTTKDAH